ncbi:YbfB/YjiJ family MFS transporter [Pantoea dispersa]|uniref:YbfB/YjiJ family MFS transporter n=1 Tax=Pantoea dispersa TaxID=59814 RepID=UPI001CA7462F|nr:YbfB/YjiJ family MFS transporter [Pantoea dispersa]QZY96410.1 YbfB/YjiJ family MFS transporter [Pantoea dispersa]
MSADSVSAGRQAVRHTRVSLITMLTGMVTLIVVMGIGRFSLTPQIPLMIANGHLSLSSAGVLAAMNYIGYLLGALHVSRITAHHARYLKAGLLATALVTLLSGFSHAWVLQCLFRVVAGIGGAWALIIVTSWTQMVLAQQAPRMSAAVFAGPGAGITLSGVLLLWRALPAALPARQRENASTAPGREVKRLWLAYTLAGFGYILPATFLSQMAHSLFAQGQLAALFWPLFGLCAVAGVVLIMLFSARLNTRLSLAWAMILQGLGVASGVLIPGVSGLLISTVIVGLGFLSIMQLSMQLARAVSNISVAKTVAILTSGYATGQLIGPLISAASVQIFASLHPALLLAAGGLVLGGLLVLRIRPH